MQRLHQPVSPFKESNISKQDGSLALSGRTRPYTLRSNTQLKTSSFKCRDLLHATATLDHSHVPTLFVTSCICTHCVFPSDSRFYISIRPILRGQWSCACHSLRCSCYVDSRQCQHRVANTLRLA